VVFVKKFSPVMAGFRALAACRLIASMLFGLTSSDIPTITVVSLLLLLVALFAGYLPARRASAIDPIVALRAE
jgi:ABC-type lipoprotein release transport system permease subunit